MRITSWNIRGRGTHGYLHKVRYIQKIAGPDILFFCDTKDQLGSIRVCGFNYLFNGFFDVNNLGLSGGLTLFWKKRML